MAQELEGTWLWTETGHAPTASSLFPWTLARAFLSSASVLEETLSNRIQSIHSSIGGAEGLTGDILESTGRELANWTVYSP